MPRGRRSRAALAAGAACLAVAAALTAHDAYLRVKAAAASVLISRAWERHLGDGAPHPPWAWADMHPIAVLEAAGARRMVLSGAGGESLAFGIGHVSGTADPNSPGNCVLAGHRDAAMAWLRGVRVGDRWLLTTRDGSADYRVAEIRVVDRRDASVLATDEGTRLTLVTCWPLTSVLHGDERLAVVAVPAAGATGSGCS